MAKTYLLVVYATLLVVVLGWSTSQANTITSTTNLLQTTNLIREIAEREGINPDLAVAIAMVESRLNPKAIGRHGEIGIYQLRPEFHKVVRGNVKANIITAMKYLKLVKMICKPKFGEAWFICYNLGPNYSKPIRYPNLFPYYVKVKREMNRIALNE